MKSQTMFICATIWVATSMNQPNPWWELVMMAIGFLHMGIALILSIAEAKDYGKDPIVPE